ncbi:MAG TPA: hypothetical protein VMW49_09195 [Candidatus Dormibacteraeota bacterium]|nr:hypothetical protein [Candidatus Dormibacteraeota bacterium]
MSPAADPRYVAARRVLLDALDALAVHRRALVIVGAQAVYLRTEPSAVRVAPFTIDGDFVLDPAQLGDEPRLEAALEAGGFRLRPADGGGVQPGLWTRRTQVGAQAIDVAVDLLVPAAWTAGGPSLRGARLGVHGKVAARRTRGLEGALVDHGPLAVGALEPEDPRVIEVAVAGPAALLVAKMHKLLDRGAGRADRLHDKDAADVVRLLQTAPTAELVPVFATLCGHGQAGPVTREALTGLQQWFAARGRPGVQMAVRALEGAMPAAQVAAICTTAVAALQEGRALR